MGESFVDVSYRGLELGKRLKLRDVRSDAGYLEIPLPMPVGTKVEIATDDGLKIEAMVTGVHEQIGGSDQHPGMKLRPVLAGAAAQWWQGRVDAAAESAERAAAEKAAAEKAAAEKAAAEKAAAETPREVPVVSSKPTMVMSADAVKEALAAADAAEGYSDDGKRTEMMSAVDPEAIPDPAAGGRTTVMDAIDISMITGAPPDDVGVATQDDDEAEISVESSGEISADMEITPSGKVATNGKNSKSRSKKRGKGKR